MKISDKHAYPYKYMKRPYGRTIWFNSYDAHSVLFGNMLGFWQITPVSHEVCTLLMKDIREVITERLGRSDVRRGIGEISNV